jgi:hypothetical protein
MKDVETLVRENLHRDADQVRFDPRRWGDRPAVRARRPRMPDLRSLGTAVAALILAAGLVVPLVLVSRLGGDPSAVPGGVTIEPTPGTTGYRRHVDLDDGLAITIPDAWAFHEDPTEPIEPENVLAVGSWPFPRGGVCAPFDALDDLPADGVFLWLIEYHGTDRPEQFVPRPDRFDLADFRFGETACYAPTPQYQLRFQNQGRFLQWQIAFGPEASESLEPEVLRALESLEVGGICDLAADAYVPAVAPVSGPPGSTSTISGEVPHGEGAEGGGPADPTRWVDFWWNLDPSEPGGWSSVFDQHPIPYGPGPVLKLGRVDVATSCTYELSFPVPDVPTGRYPIVGVYGSEDGASAFEPAWFEVTG